MFEAAIEAILRDHCTPQAVRDIEAGGSGRPLWNRIADAGFLDLLVPEADGGAALPLRELFPVLVQFGRHAMPVPAAQVIVVRALLPPGTAPAGMLTLAPRLERRDAGTWVCPWVPFGAVADGVLAADAAGWVLFDAGEAQRRPSGIPGSALATLEWPATAVVRQAGTDPPEVLENVGAALHAALLAGALARVFEMSLQHCNDRVQFSRSLGKFQAVQHQLAVMAEQVAAAGMAAEAAFQGPGPWPSRLGSAIAKARTSEAAVCVAAAAHALHGAIGVTAEFDLQLFTRRLHEWRMAHGAETWWHRRIGEILLASDEPLVRLVREA